MEIEEYEVVVVYCILLFYNFIFFGRCEKYIYIYLNLFLIIFVIL